MEELRSEEVQEILGTPPSWMVQWGTALVLIVLAALVALGWWFKYPEKVVAGLVVTTVQQPIPVSSPVEGIIGRLVVADGDSVETGDIMAVMSSSASLEDVIRLEEALKKLQTFDQESLAGFTPDPNLRLGELENDYRSLVQFLQEFSFKDSDDYDQKAIRRLKDQVKEIDKGIDALNREQRNIMQARDLAQSQFNALHYGYSGKTDQELRELQDAKDKLLQKENEVNRLNAEIADKRKERSGINLQILAIRDGLSSGAVNRFQILLQSLNSLLAKIEQWKQKNLLRAPAPGIVTYYQSTLSEGTKLEQGAAVVAILPLLVGEMELVGKMELPVAQSGKVQPGQRVLIKLTGFPFQEYGIVEGIVQNKSLLPNDGKYSVRISLPKGLNTSFGNELPFRQQMPASGEIIIQDKRLLQRLLEKMWFFR